MHEPVAFGAHVSMPVYFEHKDALGSPHVKRLFPLTFHVRHCHGLTIFKRKTLVSVVKYQPILNRPLHACRSRVAG